MDTKYTKHLSGMTAEVFTKQTDTGALQLELKLDGSILDTLTITPVMAEALKRHFAIELHVIKATRGEIEEINL